MARQLVRIELAFVTEEDTEQLGDRVQEAVRRSSDARSSRSSACGRCRSRSRRTTCDRLTDVTSRTAGAERDP